MRIFYLLIAFLFSASSITAQTTGFSGTGANIDVQQYVISWDLNPDAASPWISGTVTINFKTTVASVTAVTFDLKNSFTILSATSNLGTVTATKTGNTFSVPVNIPASGTTASVTISYQGAPPAPSGAAEGFTKTSDPLAGNVIYTLSESYEDRDWWPCKADMQDKATTDISVTVPWRSNNADPNLATDTFWVASNGRLQDSAINSITKKRTFRYINDYPIASYLVCLGVARYNRFYRDSVTLSSNRKVPVVYYLFAGKTQAKYDAVLAAMDKATEMVSLFSAKFGDYGFHDSLIGAKHGFYEGLSGGGMEHQGFSAIATGSLENTNVLIHELTHQWFGDKVSFSTWNDLWLAEGFAEYGPVLAAELTTGVGDAYTIRSGIRTQAILEKAPVRIPNSGIANSGTIWVYNNTTTGYGRSVYYRGAMVVSMLRTLCGDTKFFEIMKDYQTTAASQYKSANTAYLQQKFTDGLGVDIAPFFTDNVIGTGYPTHTIGYQFFGTGNRNVALSVVNQTLTNQGSATYITQPIVVHVRGALPTEKATLVMYNWGGGVLSVAGNGIMGPKVPGNTLTFPLTFTATSISYDDSLKTTSTGSLTALTLVDLKILSFTAKQHKGYNDATLVLDDISVNADVILERSADGRNFEDLGSMTIQASQATVKTYLFHDAAPLKADNYYRAKYKNADGVFLYSKIIKLSGEKQDLFSLVANPVHDLLQVRTAAASGDDLLMNIYDVNSKNIITKQVKNAATITNIPLPALAPGIYFLKITAAGSEGESIKFLVK